MSLAYEKYNSLCEKSIELFCIGSYAVRLEGGNFWQYCHFFSVSEKAVPLNDYKYHIITKINSPL